MAKVFFSYSNQDESLRDQLEAHLSLLKQQQIIATWHDRRMVAGTDMEATISAQMEDADIILLLVSSDFLASNYSHSSELARAMERDRAGQARVIPVILRPCDWQSAPFGHLQPVPKDGLAITMWANRDAAFTDVAKQIRAAAEQCSGPRREASQHGAPADSGTSAASDRAGTGLPPRSSNLRLKKEFSEQDRDEFLHKTFEYIGLFFRGSLQALAERNSGVEGKFDQIDSRRFTAVIYKQRKRVSECTISLDGMFHRGQSINFSYDASGRSGSINEMLSVDADHQSLFLRATGMPFSQAKREEQLSEEGAAEYLWFLLIGRLQ